MALDDAIGGDADFSPSSAVDDLINKQAGLPAGSSVNADLLANRLYRKLNTPRPTKLPAPEKDDDEEDKGKPDFSSQGVSVDKLPDFSDQGTPAPPPGSPPAAPPVSLGVTGQTKAALKGIPHGLIDQVGSALKGAASQYETGAPAQGETPNYDVMGNSTGYTNPPTPAIPAKPVKERQLYRAGQAVQDFSDQAIPMTDQEKESIGGRVGQGVGGVLPYLAAGAVNPVAGIVAGGVGMGLSSAGDTFDAALKKGASDEDAAKAAGYSAMVGGALGAIPIASILKPVKWAAPGLTGKIAGLLNDMVGERVAQLAATRGGQYATSALKEGAVFATVGEAQEALAAKIAQAYYDPNQGYSPDAKRIIASLLTGGMLGAGGKFMERRAQAAMEAAAAPAATPGAAPASAGPGGPGPGAAAAPGAGPAGGPSGGPTSPGSGAPPPPPRPEAEHGGVGADKLEKILRYYGYSAADIAAMSHAEMSAAVLREMQGKPKPASGTEQAQPQASSEQPSSTEQAERDGLKQRGFKDWQVDAMTPSQRRKTFQEGTKATGAAQPEAAPEASPEETLRKFGYDDATIKGMGAGTKQSTADMLRKSYPNGPPKATRDEPIVPKTAEDVERAQPVEPKSPAQAAAENYQHAHIELPQLGLEGSRSISIETGVGQERKGVDANGTPWSVKLTHAAYGRIKSTEGADGQPLDIFVGPHPTSPHVFVVDQHHPEGGFDEHKILAGFRTPIDALHAYAHSYNDQGKDRIGHVTAMGPEEFITWLDSGNTTKPLKKEPAVPDQETAGLEASTESPVAPAEASKETPPETGQSGRSERTIPPSENRSTPAPKNPKAISGNVEGEGAALSLLQFIATKGGMEPHPELKALDLAGDHRVQIPGRKGFFGVVRPTGMKLDMMREAAEEAGYLKGEHGKTSTVRDLLDAIDTELRGQKRHAEGEEGSKTKREHTSAKEHSDAARDKAVAAAREDIAAEYQDLPEGLLDRAAAIMADERLDLDTAVEMAAIRTVNEDPDYGVAEDDIKNAFGEDAIDEIQPRPTSDHGGPASGELRKEQGPGEGQEAGGHEPPVSSNGEAGRERAPAPSREEAFTERDVSDFVDSAVRQSPTARGIPEAVQRAVDSDASDTKLIEALTGGSSYGSRSIERGSVEHRGNVVTVTGPFGKVVLKGKKLADAIRRAFPKTTTEPTPAGEQSVIPGAEKIGQGEQAQREANKPLKPKTAQKPADQGLFGDERNQGDLLGYTPPQMRKLLKEEQEQIVNMWHQVREPIPEGASEHSKSVVNAMRRELAKEGFDRARTEDELREMLTDQRLSGRMVKATRNEVHDIIDNMLGADADRVAPADVARAAELVIDNPGMPPETAFGQAVIKNAVEQGQLTEQEAVQAYGEEVKDILGAGSEGASGGRAPVEQGGAASEQVEPGGAAQGSELPGSGEGAGEGGSHPEAAAVQADEGRAATGREPATSGSGAARNEASNAAENEPAGKNAGSVAETPDFTVVAPKDFIADGAGKDQRAAVILVNGKIVELSKAYALFGKWNGLGAHARFREESGHTNYLEMTGFADKSLSISGEDYISPAQRRTVEAIKAQAKRIPGFDLNVAYMEEGRNITDKGAANGVQGTVPASHAPTGAEDVQPAEPGGQAHGVRGREGEAGERTVPGADEGRAEGAGGLSEGAVRKRGERSGNADADRLSEPRTDNAPGGREKRATERAANLVEGENHTIEPGSLEEDRGQKAKAFANLDALELANKIVAEDRPATAEEQQVLAKYVGWGGIKNAFPDTEGKYPDASFQRLGERLKELLPDEEYATARRSIQYAHYTSEPIVRSMWDAVKRLGFEGGQVFEPGMGVGNFAGMMPAEIAAKSHYTGIELDHTTARIAKLLYPKYGVRQDDFTKMALPENAFDLVIGNPPFADVPIKSDPKYKQGFLLHDYFFAKSLDSVRPGGLLAFVTSAGTMNKMDPAAREYLAERADFIGGIRLPGDAFKKNAGTEVTTDILFLRKLLPDQKSEDWGWTQVQHVQLPGPEGTPISGNASRYFSEHPEMVLGKPDFADKLYKGRYSVKSVPGADLKADLQRAIERLPQDVMSDWQNVNQDSSERDFTTTEKKEGTYYVGPNGDLHQVSGGAGSVVKQRGKGVEGGRTSAEIDRIKGLIPIRDSLREVYAADLEGDAGNAQRARQALNKHYDSFVEKFGPINKAVIQTRRPNVIQMEGERQQAREDARYAGARFREGDFDDRGLVAEGASLSVIARERQKAREAKGEGFDEGDFDPNEVPDTVIDKRPNVDGFMDDPESYRLRAIERYDEGTGKGHKSPVFTENIITREKPPQIKSTNDALLYSLSKFGRINLPEMATLLKKSPSEVVEALGDQVFAVPGAKDTYETRDEYLSGNVRKKLALAKKAAERNPALRKNVDALEAAQPTPLAPSQIHASLGMPWIPPAHVETFGTEELGLEKLQVKYLKPLAQWVVSGDTDSVSASSTWGTPDRRAPALIEDALNRKNTKIYDKVNIDGKESAVLNVAKTEAAQDKVKAIQEKFANWIWADQDRADKLAGMYNEKYNNLVVRNYDGSYLTTPGVASNWSWRPHQKRAIARIIQSGNTYVAHAVGAGKTSEYIGAIMEMRRLGLVRKPMVAVPNHMLAQFTKEWYEQYPMAKLAIADERRFHTDRRKQFIANVAMDDLDAVIITHSAFGMIPVSDKFQNSLIQNEIDQYRSLLGQLTGGDNRITRSRVEKQIERLEQRLVGRSNRRRDQVFNFEEMGIDHLTVDEAHLFRKLDFATQMSNLKGVSPEGSGMAWDLYTKAQYLDQNRPGRSLVMGSGTPITNTMAELYTLQRFLQPQELAERGIEKFDAWAGAFGESVSELEQDAAGNYKPVSRFAKFVNVAELSSMVRQVMDVVTGKQLEQYVTRPQIQSGKRQMHLAEPSAELRMFQENLARRMEAIQKRKGPPQKGDDIMLSVINDGRHAAIDMRLAGGGKTKIASKLDMMVDNLFDIWKESKRQAFHRPAEGGGYEKKPAFTGPATQLAFTNLGLSGARGFSVPDYIRSELTRRGVPKNEIAYIYDYKNATAKQRLFNDMNEGKVRILIGSVAKMGVGTNVQRRLLAIHNMDPLWYPADDEQRNGRGVRQGNLNPEIGIHDYSTKGTYDSTMWGMMAKKAKFIQGFFEGDPSLREMDDLGEASQYEQAKALTTNDPRLIRFTELKQELERAQRRKTAFDSEAYATRQRRADAKSSIEHYTRRVADTKTDISHAIDTKGDAFMARIGKENYTERPAASDALMERLTEMMDNGVKGTASRIGDIGGFPIIAALRKSWLREGEHYHVETWLQMNGKDQARDVTSESPRGMLQSMENTIRNLPNDLEEYQARLAKAKKFYAESEDKANAKFAGQAEINKLSAEVKDMEEQLKGPTAKPEGPNLSLPAEALAGFTPAAQAQISNLESMLREVIRRVAGPSVKVDFNLGHMENKGAPGYGDNLSTAAAGIYSLGRDLIRLAISPGRADQMIVSAFHEAYHHIEARLQTAQERDLMKRETPRLREWIKGKTGLDDRQVDQLAGYEVRAIAFQTYADKRASPNQAKPDATTGIHIGMRRWFDKLMDILRQIANGLRGMGFKTYKDIFNDIYTGKVAEREPSADIGLNHMDLSAAWDIFNRRQNTNVNDRLKDLMKSTVADRFVERYQNLSKPVMRLQEAVEAKLNGTLVDSGAFYTKKRLFPGKVGAMVQDFNKDYLDPLIETAKDNNISLSQVGDILYALHAPERNRAMEEINHPALDGSDAAYVGKRSGMSNQEARDILRAHPQALVDEIDRLTGRIRSYNNALQVQAGLLSQAQANAYEAKYDHYVPLSGWDVAPEDQPEQFTGPGNFNVRGPETKRAFGRKTKADNPLINILDQSYRSIERAKKNEYIRSLNDALDALDNAETKGFVRFDKGKPKKIIDPMTGLVREVEDPQYRNEPGAVGFKVGGNQRYMIFENKELGEAIKRMHADGLGMFDPLLRMQNKIKALWTHYSPDFLFRHFIFRYPIEGTLNSFEQKESGEHAVGKYIKDAMPFLGNASRAIFSENRGAGLHADPDIAQMQRYWREMRGAGGSMTFRSMRDSDLLREHLEKTLASLNKSALQSVKDKHQAVVEAIDVVTNALDNSLRLAAFASARRQGKTPEQAGLIARDATVDFQLAGKWKNAMGIVFPFGNVAIQTGTRMTAAVARSHIMRRVFMGTMLAGFLVGAFNYLVGGDDKDGIPFFDKIPEWDRHLNFLMMSPATDKKDRKVPAKIPMPYNWAFPFTVGSAFATMIFGKRQHKMREMTSLVTKAGVEVATPFGQEHNMAALLAPELARPLINAYTNEDWNGIPVHQNPTFQKGPNSYSPRKTTGDGWNYIAQGANTATGGDKRHSGMLDMYPEDLRLLFDYVGGTQRRLLENIGQTATSLGKGESPDLTHIPLARVIAGTDYDAADRARRFERLNQEKRPWQR